MRAELVDPRSSTRESHDSRYRIFFWTGLHHSEEWKLTEADLDEVLIWINQNGQGRTHSLWVVFEREADVELVFRLRGIDPPAPLDTWPAWAGEAR